MKNKNIIKIGSKQTQLFQKCPECNTLVKIPRKMEYFDGCMDVYHYWTFPYSVDCPKCNKEWKFTRVEVDIPEEHRIIKTQNSTLYAFDIGMPPAKKKFAPKYFNNYGKSVIQKRYSYVAFFQEGIQFLEDIYSSRWSDNPKGVFYDGSAYVITDIYHDGTVETYIA